MRLLITLFILLIMASSVFADIKIKDYTNSKENVKKVQEMIDRAKVLEQENPRIFDKLKQIQITRYKPWIGCGQYVYQNHITLSCVEEHTFIHELAHYTQYRIHKDNLYQLRTHKGHFCSELVRLWETVYGDYYTFAFYNMKVHYCGEDN